MTARFPFRTAVTAATYCVGLTLPAATLAASSWLPVRRRDPPPPATTLRLLYTNDTDGYLQSCGCTANQAGGLAKRATLLKRLRNAAEEKGIPVLLLDGGNIADDTEKAGAVVQSMVRMRYDALGWADRETQLGPPLRLMCRDERLPLVACPVPQGAEADNVKEYVEVTKNGHKIGIIALRPGTAQQILPALRKTLFQLRRDAHFVVALSALSADTERAVLADSEVKGKIDVVVGRRGEDRTGVRDPQSGVFRLPVTLRGEIGVAGVKHTVVGKTIVSANFLEPLTDKEISDPEIEGLVGDYFRKQARLLREASLGDAQGNTGYAATSQCASCHASETAQWQKTKHAHAAETLREKSRLVGECLSCHSELYRRTKTFDAAPPAAWHGITCTTCHGDGVLHTALRTKQSVTRSPGETFCKECHNAQNDPKFTYASYMQRIKHWK